MTQAATHGCEAQIHQRGGLGLESCAKVATHVTPHLGVLLCSTHHAQWVRRGWTEPGRRLTR